MTTKAEQFSAKIRNLVDYQNKILYNVAPLPTGVDIANTLKYFIHTLRSILKGAPPDLPGGRHPSRKRVNFRLDDFPSLDYLGLFETLVCLVDIVPNIQYGQFAFGHAILQLFGVIIWFLEPETVDTIPYTVASTLAVFPLALQPDTIDLLAGTLLPICLSDVQHWDGETFSTMSMSSVILLVLQHTKNNKKNKELKARALNAQILECIMTYKEGVFRDILSAIAFGPATARAAGAQLLFHYWPTLVPTSNDNRDFKYCSWKPFLCQRSNCLSPVNNAAVKMCLDPAIAATYSKEPPPFYLCSVCSDHISREEQQFVTYDVLYPLERETRTCENKNCASSDRTATYTCFASDCVRQNGGVPISYCTECHQHIHPREVRQDHVVQSFPSDPWACDKETQIYLVEAIISLLKEARVEEVDPLMAAMEVTVEPESTDEYSQLPMESDGTDDEDAVDRDPRLLSRFGLWLLIEKCTPNRKTSDEVIGRLLSMLFQWFGFTATLTQDSIVLESLKKEYVTEWILKLLKTHFNVFASCLMPSPPEYGKVGGYWDTLCSRITELQEGLKKIFSMTPYNAITFEVWHEMMPVWMDAICTDIDEKDLPQLQEVLCKLFDIDISPLPFSTQKTFEFVACKFKETPAKTQEKALLWLQVLSETDIVIPMKLTLSMFRDGLSSMTVIQNAKVTKLTPKPAPPPPEAAGQDAPAKGDATQKTDEARPSTTGDLNKNQTRKEAQVEQNLPTLTVDPSALTSDLDEKALVEQTDEEVVRCYVMMLDLIILQIDLQRVRAHEGLEHNQSKDYLNLLTQMLQTPWVSEVRAKDPPRPPPAAEEDGKTAKKETKENKDEKETKEEKDKEPMPPVQPVGHKCSNICEPPSTEAPTTPCGLCELWTLWYQLAQQLLRHISPQNESRIADNQEVSEDQFEKSMEEALALCKAQMNNSNDVKTKKNRVSDRSLTKGGRKINKNKENKGIFVASEAKKVEVFVPQTVKLTTKDLKAEREKALAKRLQKQQQADGKLGNDISKLNKNNKDGTKGKRDDHFNPEELTKASQLLLVLLKEVPKHHDSNILLSLVTCVKILCLNAECLRMAAKDNPGFLSFAQKNLLIPSFWKLLRGNLSAVVQVVVPLALHCASLTTGSDILWDIVDNEMESQNWQMRFQSVERVAVLVRHVEKKMIGGNTVIMGCLAHAFCLLISSSEDICPAVSARSILMLETVPTKSLRILINCLEFQWDSVLEDRVLILSHMHLLQHYLKEVQVLTWEFFMNRLDTLALEAHVDKEQNKEFPFPMDTSRSSAGLADRTDLFLNKLNRARLARSQSEISGTLKPRRLSAYFSKNDDKMRSKSMPTGLSFSRVRVIASDKSTYSRPSTIVTKTVPGVGDPLADGVFEDGYLPTVTEDAATTATTTAGTATTTTAAASSGPDPSLSLDFSHIDKETVHRLVDLLLIFMTHDKSSVDDINGRAMNTVIGHLSVLLGYNQPDREFTLPPQQLRESAVFYAFMTRLPRMLDYNVEVGNIILPLVLDLLQHCPAPQKAVMENQPIDYTLYFLEPHCRQAWLTSLLVILYKYSYDQVEYKTILRGLIRITINLLEAQRHRCKPKRPEPPTIEDIWGASETPPAKDKKEFTLPNTLDDVEEASEDTSSIPSAGPTTPLLAASVTTAADVMPTFTSPTPLYTASTPVQHSFMRADMLHQQIDPIDEDSEMMMVVPEDAVQTLTIKPTNRGLVASTIVEVEEEEHEEMPESLEAVSKVEAVQAKASIVGIERVVKMTRKQEFVIQQATTVTAGGPGKGQAVQTQVMGTMPTAPQAVATQHVVAMSLDRSKIQPKYRSKRARKLGVSTGHGEDTHPDLLVHGESPLKGKFARERRLRKIQKLREQMQKSPEKKSSVYSAVRKYHDDKNYMALTKCLDCGAILEECDDNTISLAIVVLSTFIHRDPELAAPMLLEMLQVVGRIASATFYTWQTDSSGHPPGHCCTVASQFLRCVLHKLAPNGIFPQLFLSKIEDYTFLKTMAIALTDFNELTPTDAITHLLEGLNEKKTLPPLRILLVVMNLAEYMDHLPLEGASIWTNLVTLFETFLRKLILFLPDNCDMNDTFRIIEILFRSPANKNLVTLLEPVGKLVSFAIQKARFKLKHLLEICSLCNRIFMKEREKQSLSRCVVLEFQSALKFKSCLADINLIQLVQFVMVDAGGKMNDFSIVDGEWDIEFGQHCTGAMDCMRQYLQDAIEYIGDLHTLTKVKNNLKGGSQNLNEDTLGSQLKAGVAQIIALEFTRCNQAEGTKAIQRCLPWLYHPPAAVQIGPKEFIDCISHVRLLSWLLLGSLTHTAISLQSGESGILSQPVPLDAGTHIADHVQVILGGFAEQSKASVLHMSSLFHAFILCQLWTMYCEQIASINAAGSEHHSSAMLSIMDFWGRVTPGVLQLLSHTKVLADMVNLHFLSLMEALQECNSSVLAKLFPLWTQILFSYPTKLQGNLQVRLQNCENWPPPNPAKGDVMSYHSTMLLKWLKRLQFKMGQIEIQSSAATQFYTV